MQRHFPGHCHHISCRHRLHRLAVLRQRQLHTAEGGGGKINFYGCRGIGDTAQTRQDRLLGGSQLLGGNIPLPAQL